MLGDGGVVTFKWQGIVRIIPSDELRGIDDAGPTNVSMTVFTTTFNRGLAIIFDPENPRALSPSPQYINERYATMLAVKARMVEDLLDGMESRVYWTYDDVAHAWARSETK